MENFKEKVAKELGIDLDIVTLDENKEFLAMCENVKYRINVEKEEINLLEDTEFKEIADKNKERLEKKLKDEEEEYFLKNPLERRWHNMINAFFIDYNNYHEKVYYGYELENKGEDFDWRNFINKIPSNRFTGATNRSFQKALQDSHIAFWYLSRYTEKEFKEFMEFVDNKGKFKILEHGNIGNY
jgi:hypothetical protein